ncbi:MAG: glucose-6-phosphate dehydrogenase [Phycisphaerae bacterium]|nr:glucose-6-phosphate dehydrogenase [Phycisphaerae bacterium]
MNARHANPDPCILVIFGASGDLTHRKLIPALYELSRGNGGRARLPERLAILGVSRTPMSDDQFRDKLRGSAKAHAAGFDEASWSAFARCIHYHAGDAASPESYPALADRLARLGAEHRLAMPTGGANLLFYLSVSPNLYVPIIGSLGESGLIAEGKRWCSIDPSATPWQRIIVEKPFGTDLGSAQSLNMALGRVFEEDAIYRIDHYLGKELVQNILVMRFANSIFEPIWNRSSIDHVQVTAAETLGVGSRAANFYDTAGAMRDMVQSHLLEVLALVAIEPPSVFDADASHREKIKLFNSARSIEPASAHESAVFGRYARGKPDEPAYVEEAGVDPARRTETYCAMRVEFDNWRWAGVPFYLRSGKRLAKKLTEVVVQFRRPPVNLFREVDGVGEMGANRLIINIAPTEGLELHVLGKVPGAGLRIDAANLNLDYIDRFGGEKVEAYGPLILDAMRGDRSLYKHRDQIEGTWRICQPLLESATLRERIEDYATGSWGPRGAEALLARDGRAWHNPA